MAPTLGKRKRITRDELEQPSRPPSPSSASSESESDSEDVQDIFRRAFEAKFKPLEVDSKKPRVEEVNLELEDQEEEDSDWSGITSDEEEQVQVVEYSHLRHTGDRASKAEQRAFMSSKPPTLSGSTLFKTRPSTKAPADENDLTEASHLKNDVALQRLLRDSHLLSSTSTSGTSTPTLSAVGSQRHKSTDLHLLSLGAKSSIHAQKNMPMSHRIGISAKAKEREERRRAEAKENGVILEKERRAKKFTKERERGVGGPGVGKFRGGTLSLSKKDVRDITSSGGGRGGKGKGKRGRR
ncbi:hypothetical protein BDV96DRAFT_600056 [Lophiotrema nucula]|uniref:Uncharacterized protein n=1 Tax=Lophiotrema nucula TaxID=690887 RepID=A0A6A5Z764_9PLEO|nr:hypothetical protein BDV96DRAFT_600056 [Lophiotrema nucula]